KASSERIAEVLGTEPAVRSPERPRPLPVGGPAGAVRFEDVRFRYPSGAGTAVLDGFTLDVAAGSSVAIVGATGSGKTTVPQLLARFYDVDAGRVLLDGVDVREVDLDELRRNVAIVFEETFLFHDSIAANVAFARPDAPLDEVLWAAGLAGADEFVAEMDEGYATIVGERGFSLSGGQRQRLAIARALLARPRVLVFDDATSAVDPTKEREIRDRLGEALSGVTTLVITHRLATIALADRVVLLDGGRVAASGTHEELLTSNARYREVLASSAPALPDVAVTD
ncbi:MAG: ATP-binding cassette domain-containing protein, partial [Acidimicrobiia bacterium]|nr:ATP-binding cassette domain-containing protein [Acidimicrobiia bacterium]